MKTLKYFLCSSCWAVLILCISSTILHAAPITFNTALPLSQGQKLVRGLVSYQEQSRSSELSTVSRDQLTLNSVFAYGVSAKWAVFGVLPISNISVQSGSQNSDESDLGDAEIFSRYEVWRSDSSGVTKRIAPFLGLRVPSGETGLTSDGTTDIFGGLVITSSNINGSFDVQFKFDINGNNERINVGDAFSLDVSWQRRIAPSKLEASTRGIWFVALESNTQYSKESRVFGQTNPDTGGFVSSIAPGDQYVTRRWIAELAVRIPIIENLNGNGIETDFTVFTGLRANF